MPEKKIRKPYDAHKRVMQHVGEDSHVQQHLREETDINNIMSKYYKTGSITHLAGKAGQYGDFSDVTDYKTGLERILAADELFSSLPAKTRQRFSNDPAEFIEFATDPDNLDEMRKMGLAPPKAPEVERSSLGTEGAVEPPTEAPTKK